MANPETEALSIGQAAEKIGGLLDNDRFIMGDEPKEETEEEASPEEEAEAGEEESEPVEAEADEEEESEESSDTEPEQAAIETLADVAEALGVEEKTLLDTLKMRIKVNGEEQLKSLADVQKGHQLEADYRRKTTELAEQRRAYDQERQQMSESYQNYARDLSGTMAMVEQLIIGELNTPAMQELRQKNPTEWNARQIEAQQKRERLQYLRQQAAAQWQQNQQQSMGEAQKRLADHMEAQQASLQSSIPEWGESRREEVSRFLKEAYGATEDSLSRATDAWMIRAAFDAMQARERTAKEELTVKKVKAKPKLQRPGKGQSKLSIERQRIAELKGRLKKTGNVQDAAKAIEALM